MKKLFLLIILQLFIVTIFAQYSISYMGENIGSPARTATIPLVSSNGSFYFFQSREQSIHIRKYSAYNMNFSYVPYSVITIGTKLTINGVFEDGQYFIIYGVDEEYEGKKFGFILKINNLNYNPVALKYLNQEITDGCLGEKDSNFPSNESCYAFIAKDGTIFMTNTSLNLYNYQYYLNNAHPDHISWNDILKRFMVSGYTIPNININSTEYPFFLSFKLNSKHSCNWYLNNSIILKEGIYNRNTNGRVLHCLLNDGRVLLAQSTTSTNISKLNFALLEIQANPIVLDQYKMIELPVISNYDIYLNDIKNNVIRNTISLTANYNNISLASILSVNQNNINIEPYQIFDYGIFNKLTYNPFDTIGAINISTSLFNFNSNILSGVLFEHNTFSTTCAQLVTNLVEVITTPLQSNITSSVCENVTSYVKPLPNRIMSQPWGAGAFCEGYHSNIWTKDESEDKALIDFGSNSNVDRCDIQMILSDIFLLQGFKGSVTCEIYDMTGKQVYSVISENDMNNSIPDLSKGIYILKAIDNFGNNKTVKFFKD